MKKLFLGLLFLSFLIPSFSSADVWVNGYYRSNGTYVNGHYRSSPDSNPYNNYSYPGNTNPYTGNVAPGNSSTYLNNYYNSSSGSSYSPSYYSTTPTCPINSYSSGSSCKCVYGYVARGGSCVSGNSLCRNQLGIMSSYNSLNNSCECDAGYVIGGSGFCTYKSSTYTSNPTSVYSGSSPTESTCPAHSSESVSDSSKCTCDVGYQLDKKKTACAKIPAKTNDKLCRVEFGSKSEWDGTYVEGSENEPYCDCKSGYDWNSAETACIKSK